MQENLINSLSNQLLLRGNTRQILTIEKIIVKYYNKKRLDELTKFIKNELVNNSIPKHLVLLAQEEVNKKEITKV